MLVGLREQLRPAGETVELRETVPVNPLIGATETVELPVAPARTVTEVGPAVTEKSGIAILYVTVV